MTDFDPNATPECDNIQRPCSDFINEEFVVYISDAEKLERRARIAEEKLRIAMEVLTTSCVYDYTDLQTALKEIYEVDP